MSVKSPPISFISSIIPLSAKFLIFAPSALFLTSPETLALFSSSFSPKYGPTNPPIPVIKTFLPFQFI